MNLYLCVLITAPFAFICLFILTFDFIFNIKNFYYKLFVFIMMYLHFLLYKKFDV